MTIYVVNLHGSSKTNEVSPDGSKDENVFDIQQGVAIILLVKKSVVSNNKTIVKYQDLWGLRSHKYENLLSKSIKRFEFETVEPKEPNFYFNPTNLELKAEFDSGIDLSNLFVNYSSGVQTEFDEIAVQENREESHEVLNKIISLTSDELIKKFNQPKKAKKKFDRAKDDLETNPHNIYPLAYRPFEKKSVIYTGKSNGLMGRPRGSFMRHLHTNENISLVLKRARLLGKKKIFNHCFISDSMVDKNFLSDQSYCFQFILILKKVLNKPSTAPPNANPTSIQKSSKRLRMAWV